MRLLAATFTCLFVFTAADGLATSDLDQRVNSWLTPLVRSGDFQGVVVVARGNTILVNRAYGKADWDLNVAVSSGSVFRIASITKTFTAAAIVLLAERGKLSYADPLSKFVPDFPRGDKITIRHLLLHQSGVPNPDSAPCSNASLDDLIAETSRKSPWFAPGTASGYSNGGYALLARIVERASGTTWETFLRENIFSALKLSQTMADSSRAPVSMRVRAFVPGPPPAGVHHAACEGAWAAVGGGSLLSSAPDLVKWGRAVRNETLFKRTALEHPYGWGVRKYFARNVIEQSGILNGSASYIAVYPDDDLYVVVLSNVQTGLLIDIGKSLAALALDAAPISVVPVAPAVRSTAEQRKQWLGRYKNEKIATVTLTENGGELYLRWDDAPQTAFVALTGSHTAHNRQDSVAMELAPDGASLRMRWPGGEWQEFLRLPQ